MIFTERETVEEIRETLIETKQKGENSEHKQDILEMEFDDSPRRERSKRGAVKKASEKVNERVRITDTEQSNGDRSKVQTRNRGRKLDADKCVTNNGETDGSERMEGEQYVDKTKPNKQLKGSRIRGKVEKNLETGTENISEVQGEQIDDVIDSDIEILAPSKRTRAKRKAADDQTTESDMERESTTQDETSPEEGIKTVQGKMTKRRNAVGRQESSSPADELTERNAKKKAKGKRANIIQSETSDDEPTKVARRERRNRKHPHTLQRETSHDDSMETGTDNSRGAKKEKLSGCGSVGANAKSVIKGDEKEIETTDDEIDVVDAVEEKTASKNTKIDEHSTRGDTTADKESEYERKGKLAATEHDSTKARNKIHHSAMNDAVSDSEPERRVKQHIGDKKNEELEIEEISEESESRHRSGRNQAGTDEIEIELADTEPKKRRKKKKGKPKVKVNLRRIAQEVDFSSEEEEQTKPSEPIVHEAVVHHRATNFYDPILKEADLYSESSFFKVDRKVNSY